MKISEIKKGVPVPPRGEILWGDITRAVNEMQPGDYREFNNGNNASICKSVLMAGKRAGFKVTTRKLNGKGIGAWRIK